MHSLTSSVRLRIVGLTGLLLACSTSGTGGGGTGGQAAGARTGGAVTGGTTTGGSVSSGGLITTGGSATGGIAATGGRTTGGIPASGGTATGGLRATGGISTTGGISQSGGVPSTGGLPTGGSATGGAGTGGVATGGIATGGNNTTGGAMQDSGVPADTAPPTNDATVDAGSAARSPGCGKATTRPDPAKQQTIQVSGTARTYQIFVPAAYSPDTALPLIFALHGGGGTSAGARSDFKLESVGTNAAVIVYPNNMTNYATGNDMAFFDALLADATNTYCVDTHRVFATGFSMGGIFVNGVGCLRGGTKVRGIIPVAGSGPNPNLGPASEADIACPAGTPTADVAVMIIHGTADANALFKYAQWEANYWTRAEGCTSTTANLASPYQGCVAYQGCRVPVDFCQHTGGHMVPSTAAANIWAFINSLP